MSHRVEITPSARKALAALPREIQRRVDAEIRALSNNPRPRGAIKLGGEKNLYRVRLGAYRIVYRLQELDAVLVVVRFARRTESTYRGL